MRQQIYRLFRRLVGEDRLVRFIARLAAACRLDLLTIAHRSVGISNAEDHYVTGEWHLIENVLPTFLGSRSALVFDVGANVGIYSKRLRQKFPHLTIHAFEPNPHAFPKLRKETESLSVNVHNIGFSSISREAFITVYPDELHTSHANLCGDALREILHKDRLSTVPVTLATGDAFCLSNNISRIDFMKIDVEGHEVEVLRGFSEMLRRGNISAIQFEFTQLNVVVRVFLKDFYDLLPDYMIYRLLPCRLLPLPTYDPRQEVFWYHNYLAVHKGLPFSP